MLQPLAAPAVLGWFALGSALIVWGTWFAVGWGGETEYRSFFPFLLFFGGFGQLGAALWSYRARAAVSAALHGSWAAFWLGLSLVYLLATTHAIGIPSRGQEWQSLGQWLIYMAVISATTAAAALARNRVAALAQATLAVGTALAAASRLAPSPGLEQAAGWVLVAAGVIGFWVGAALMLGSQDAVEDAAGDPGVKAGQ
jgi:uncharacterized protein